MNPPKKSLGQHFLVDPAICETILRLGSFSSSDTVLEIGPGRGAMTRPLIRTVGRVIAVELDGDLVRELSHQLNLEALPVGLDGFPTYRAGGLTLMEADVRRVALADLSPDAGRAPGIRVVGNLPYNQSTAILQTLLEQRDYIQDLSLMFQREVADRLLALPGRREYGYLSVLVQFHCTVERLFHVGAKAFYPRPKIESTVVRLVPIRPDRLDPAGRGRFLKLISASFAAKRKTLLNNLRPQFKEQPSGWIEERCIQAAIDPGRRAETLSVDEFIALASQLEN